MSSAIRRITNFVRRHPVFCAFLFTLLMTLGIRWFTQPFNQPVLVAGDVREYLKVSSQSLASKRFWYTIRSPGLPLVIKVFRQNLEAVTLFMFIVSALSWSLFAACTARLMRSKWTKLCWLVLISFFAGGITVSLWDRWILPESLALSTSLIACACLTMFIHAALVDPRQVRMWLLVTAGAASAFTAITRDGASLLCMLIIVIVTLVATRAVQFSQRRLWQITGVLCCLLFVTLAMGPQSRERFLSRNVYNVYLQRILPVPENLAFVEERGFPVTPAVRKHFGAWYWDSNHEVRFLNDVRD